MTKNKSLLILGTLLAIVLAVTASSVTAGTGTLNYLSINRPAALPGAVLTPGPYVFEVVPGHVDLVRVTSRLTNRAVFLGFTNRVERPHDLPRGEILRFAEVPAGQPRPIQAWFPLGSSTGHEFRHR